MIDAHEKKRIQRKTIIKAIYRTIYKTESEQKKHLDVLEEVIYQDHICKGFCKTFTELELKELLQCKSAIQVSNRTRPYKGLTA